MNSTNRHTLRTATVAVLGVLFAVTGCQDLDVENPNAPDRSRALATPGDVASLIGGAYRNIWYVQQHWAPGPAQSTMADDHSASWGNFGMKFLSSEPRVAINNNPAWSYAYVIEEPWYFPYGSIVAASDGLRALEDVDLENGARARAFARWMQGMGHAYLALNYDRAFVVDETTDLTGEQELKPYNEVMQAALGYMNEALQIANNNSFQLPNGWINGRPLSSDRMSRLIHSYMARFMASVPRSPDEASQVDWASVANHVDQGIQQDFTVGGSVWFSGHWWSPFKHYGGQFPIWGRTDLEFIGRGDTDGDWQAWMNTPVESRQPFLLNTPDKRITKGIDQPKTSGSQYTYYPTIAFVPGRGTYHFSNYNLNEYPHPSTGYDPEEMTTVEMDLLKAEAMLRQGNRQAAVDLINKTRTANGKLPAVTTEGVPQSDTCVPQTMDGCGSLWDALKWEKQIETHLLSSGIPYWDDRRWGDLESGTAVHFPIPGSELQVLQKEIYTFGGSGGEGAAPSIQELGEMSIGERVKYDLQKLESMLQKSQERMEKKLDQPQ